MSDVPSTADMLAANPRSLQTLVRSLSLSRGQFSLILVRCNYQRLRQGVIESLQAQGWEGLNVVQVPPSVSSLYPVIQTELAGTVPTALMVTGLEGVHHLEAVLGNANLMREEFRKHLPCPLVLWATDEVFQALTRYASDLKSWSTASIRFTIPVEALIQSLHRHAEQVFQQLLSAGGDRFVPDRVLDLEPGSRLRTELDAALADIHGSGRVLDPELQASLEFLNGREAHAQLHMEQAQQSYEQSLHFWQSRSALNQAIVRFHLGLWWRSYATLQRATYQQSCEQARGYFEQCLAIFRQEQRLDLVAKFIPALEEVLQKLGAWTELARVAQEAIALHQGRDPIRLARDYGFLAEVAVSQSQWEDAQRLTTQALQILQQTIPLTEPSPQPLDLGYELDLASRFHIGWLFFLRGRSQGELGDSDGAIASLKTAQQSVAVEDDPILYIRILRQLRDLYFAQGDYRRAFQVKQMRRRIEQKYGFRAFAGAGRLEPQRLANLAALWPSSPEGIVTQEITASGRQQDVVRLVARVATPRDRLTVLHGPSGVGKSSLVAAGLVPALAQQTVEARRVMPLVVSVYTDWLALLGTQLTAQLMELKWLTPDPSPPPAEVSPVPAPTDRPPAPSPMAGILEELRQNPDRYLHTVLIFDQFEEFFFVCPTLAQRRPFYQFLKQCLALPYIDVMLSIREDYLHYLLEIERLTQLDEIISDGILSKGVRYPLGDFDPEDAKTVIRTLTERSQFYLEEALIDAVVEDLTSETGGVRPIELQIVGAQLQQERDRIDSLAEYRRLGDHPKETLVQRFLQEVVQDCGPENEAIAQLILYLLTDENEARPFKTQAELAEELGAWNLPDNPDQLNLVLGILSGSGLVLTLPEAPADLYQLVHDYLVRYIRNQHHSGAAAALDVERERRQLTEAELQATNRRLEATLQAERAARDRATLTAIQAQITAAQALQQAQRPSEALTYAVKAGQAIQTLATSSAMPPVVEAIASQTLYQLLAASPELNPLLDAEDGAIAVEPSSIPPLKDLLALAEQRLPPP